MSAESKPAYDQIDGSFKGVFNAYKRGIYSSPGVQALYELVKPNAVGLVNGIGRHYAKSENPTVTLFSAASLEFRIQNNRGIGGILERVTATPRVSRMGDLVGFYHYLAGITSMEGEPKPTHGFANPNPTFLDLTIADYFYQRADDIFTRFIDKWKNVEGKRRGFKETRPSNENRAKVNNIIGEGLFEDWLHLWAFVNGTKAIALSAWQAFSEREDVTDKERRAARIMVGRYERDIVNSRGVSRFDEELVDDPKSKPSPSSIGTLQFFPGRVE